MEVLLILGVHLKWETSLVLLQTHYTVVIQGFVKPHDLAVSSDGLSVYVAEIGPNNVWKFSVTSEWCAYYVCIMCVCVCVVLTINFYHQNIKQSFLQSRQMTHQ